MSDNEEIFVNPDDLDMELEGDPLAPSPPAAGHNGSQQPPAASAGGAAPGGNGMSESDILNQLRSLQETAARLESMLHHPSQTPQELPTETEIPQQQSDTWAGPISSDTPLPPLPPPTMKQQEAPTQPTHQTDPFAPVADPFGDVTPPTDPFGDTTAPANPFGETAPPANPFDAPAEQFAPYSPDQAPPGLPDFGQSHQTPPNIPFPGPSIPFPGAEQAPPVDPYAPPSADPFAQPIMQDPYAQQPAEPPYIAPPTDARPDPFGQSPQAQPDPFGQPQFPSQPDPFGQPPAAVPDPYNQHPQAPQADPFSDPYAQQPVDPYAADPYAQGEAVQPSQGLYGETHAPSDRLPDPYAQQPADVGGYAPPALMGSPLDEFLAQDVLAAISQHGGNGRVMELQQEAALTRLREESRARIKESRVKKNSRGKGAPRFIRVKTQFRPGEPLVISVTSPKGGVGKSTTAANLAAYYAKAAAISGLEEQVRVLLVDGDVANGNLALRVAQRLEPNMLDLLNHMDEVRSSGQNLDAYGRDMAPFVLAHPKIKNLDILAAPDNPDVLEQIEQEDLEYLMATFSKFYQVVVFDTGTQIVEHTNCAWLNFSSQVYLMVEPEIACLQVTAEYAKRARRLQLITPEVCRLVMIRADMDLDNLDPQKVAQDVFSFIRPDRAFFIPDFHRDAIETGNAGEFLVLDSAAYAEALTPIISSSLETYEQNL